jgi:hypothetical protein
VLAAIAVTAIALAFFAVDTLNNAPETFVAIIAIGLLSVGLDLFWKRSHDARPRAGKAMTSGGEAVPPPAREGGTVTAARVSARTRLARTALPRRRRATGACA